MKKISVYFMMCFLSFSVFLNPMPSNMREYVVTQSQTLIQATYAMTVWEQRLLLSCISQIDSRLPMPEDNAYTLTVEQARDLFYTDANAQNVYRDMARAVEKLYERDVKIQLPDNETLQTRFISSVLWSPDKYQITLKFAPDIRPYLSQLQNNFAGYKLKNIVQLTSSYAIRLYEKLVGWAVRDMYYQEMEVAAFREMLALGDKYSQIGQLKARVIEPAVQQINANTDFSLDVSFKKCKREVRWIQLRFNQKAEAAAAATEAKKQRDARALQNQAAKANRAIQERKQAAAAAVQTALSEWQSLPDGSIFTHQDGSVWRKDGSTLYSKEKNARIVEAQIPHLLASGQLAHLPPHPPAPPVPTEEESEAQMWQNIPATDDEQEEFNVAQNELTMKEQRLLMLWERGLITREEYLSMILPPEPPPELAPDDPSAY